MYQAYASSKLRKIFVEREQLCQAVQQSSIQNQPKLAFVVDPLTIPIFLNIFAHFTPNMTFCGVETSDWHKSSSFEIRNSLSVSQWGEGWSVQKLKLRPRSICISIQTYNWDSPQLLIACVSLRCTIGSWSPNSTYLHLDFYLLLCQHTKKKDIAG